MSRLHRSPGVGKAETSNELSAGEHHVALKNFMEDETICQGQLYVQGDRDLVIGVSQGQCLQVFSDPGAFSRR